MKTFPMGGVCLLLWAGAVVAAEPPERDGPGLEGFDLGQPAKARPAGRVERPPVAAACLKGEPDVDALVRAAWASAGLGAEDDRDRRSRLRIAGWLPKLDAGVRYDWGDRWDYRYEPGEPRVDQLHRDDGYSWDVGLSLDLAQAAYPDAELAAAREAVRRAAERRELAVEIIRLDFERRSLLVHGLPAARSPDRLRLDELTAVLDAWTGGAFARRFCGRTP